MCSDGTEMVNKWREGKADGNLLVVGDLDCRWSVGEEEIVSRVSRNVY